MKINVNCKGAQCADAPKDEASSTGNLKGRKNIMDAINRGYIFEALDLAHEVTENALKEVDGADEALKGCQEQLEKLDDLRSKLNEVGAAALRTSITNLYSPEHRRDAARDKMLKEAVKLLYEIFGDLDAGREMVLTYTSSLATNAKRALLQDKNAVEVTKADLEASGLTEDSKELVTITSTSARRANAGMADALKPLIDQAKIVAEAAGTDADATVPASEYQELLKQLTEMYDNASRIVTTVTTAVDFEPSDLIKQLKAVPEEARQDEGFFDKLIDMFKKLADGLTTAFASLKKAFTDLFSDVEAANETYAKTSKALMELGFAPVEEAKAPEAPKAEEKRNFCTLEAKLQGAFEELAKHSEALDIDNELFLASEALVHAREALEGLSGSVSALKCVAEMPKNEDNLAVIGVLADAIAQIAQDTEGDIESSGEEPSVNDQVSAEYSEPEEEPEEVEGPEGGEEPMPI